MATNRDLYDVLGVNKSASSAEIKSAYRKLALKWHPDKNKEANATDKFKEINEAYEVLGNPDKKAKYDQFGHAAFGNQSGGGNPFGQAGGNPFGGGFYQAGGNVNFEDLFGNGGGFNDPFDIFSSFFGGQSGQRRQVNPHYSLTLTFNEAVHGTEKTIVHQGKEFNIKIPAGVDNGNRMRFTDFDLSFKVKPSSTFQREGFDVSVVQEVPLILAILGGEIEIPTLEGNLKIRLKPGTQPETLVRLSGKGVKHLQGSGRGDLYIRYAVKIPTKLTSKQKEILSQF